MMSLGRSRAVGAAVLVLSSFHFGCEGSGVEEKTEDGPGFVSVVSGFPDVFGKIFLYLGDEPSPISGLIGRGDEVIELAAGWWLYSAVTERDFEWQGEFLVEPGKTTVVTLSSELCTSTMVASWSESKDFLPTVLLVDGVDVGEIASEWVPNPIDEIDDDGPVSCGSVRSYFLSAVDDGRAIVSAVPLGSRKKFELQGSSTVVRRTVDGSSELCLATVFFR